MEDYEDSKGLPSSMLGSPKPPRPTDDPSWVPVAGKLEPRPAKDENPTDASCCQD
jgi:hypothetical protein